jgi:carbon-monoxide dehydrogenase large subunit
MLRSYDPAAPVSGLGFGSPVRRVEDQRLITGKGQYVDDIKLPNQAVAYFLRSPLAHAKINSLDTSDAKTTPGVLAVYTSEEIEAAGLGHLNFRIPPSFFKGKDGKGLHPSDRPLLARGKVHFVGDIVAMVVAESVAAAKDASERIVIDYEDLPAVGTIEEAIAPDAPVIWPGDPRGNVAIEWEAGQPDNTKEAFARAEHVTKLRLVNNRIVVASMEMRGAIGQYDAASDSYTLYAGTQGSHSVRDAVARDLLKIDREKLRVISPDVGGGFGMKHGPYPEYPLVLFASKNLGRPVKWTSERTEAFQSDAHGRDLVTEAELALTKDGKILGLHMKTWYAIGGYSTTIGPVIQTLAPVRVLGGIYKVPAIHNEVMAVYTNTVPVDAYRGAGRPEVAYIMERLMSAAAWELGIGQDEIRAKNLIRKEDFPYTTVMGCTFDSGDTIRNLEDAKRISEWESFAQRKAEAAKRGRLRGIGMAYYTELTMSAAQTEDVKVAFAEDGKVELFVGTFNHGQGHETAFAQLLADKMQIPLEKIRFRQGDTDAIAVGNGTGGSRSLWMTGNATVIAAENLIEKAKQAASDLLEAAAGDIELAKGKFTIAGTDRSLGWDEIAEAVREKSRLSPETKEAVAEGLTTIGTYKMTDSTFPNGCHICEVEIDPDTGVTEIAAYTVVDDFGRVLNPMIVAGQVHGGIAQGVGQALFENCVYEPGTGQLLTGSFMDYTMPRADNFPPFKFAYNEIPCATNPLGIKGCGEAGTVGAMPAAINAVVDALRDLGITHIDMPATPLKVWEAIQAAKKARAA